MESKRVSLQGSTEEENNGVFWNFGEDLLDKYTSISDSVNRQVPRVSFDDVPGPSLQKSIKVARTLTPDLFCDNLVMDLDGGNGGGGGGGNGGGTTSVERSDDFYDSQDTVHIGRISARLFYNETAGAFFIYWRKDNSGFSNEIKDSHLKASVFELDLILPKLRELINSIVTTPMKSTIPFLHGDLAQYEDRFTEQFWEDAYCIKTPSKGLLIRVLRMENGTYRFIMRTPKAGSNLQGNYKRGGGGGGWIGSSCSFFLGEIRRFVMFVERACAQVIRYEQEELMGGKPMIHFPKLMDQNGDGNFTTVDGIPNADFPLQL